MVQYHTNEKVYEAAKTLCTLHFQVEETVAFNTENKENNET
jgi:hypothetical protein